MGTFRFLNFPVYQEAKLFYKDIYFLTKGWKRINYELADQLRRASLSVCLNLAEGSAKKSDKDFRRYIQNSLGSINEVVACLDVALTVNLISSKKHITLIERSNNIAKQLGGFSRKLQTKK